MKATKISLAALMLAGSFGIAMAQGEGPKGSDANPPKAVKMQNGESKSAPVQGAQAPAKMKTAPTGMSNGTSKTPASAGTQTGTAKDPAGPGADVKAPGSGNK